MSDNQIRYDSFIIVESDRRVAALLENALRELEFSVDRVCHDTQSAFATFYDLNFSRYHPLVILDGDLDQGGSEVIARFLTNKGVKFILHTDRALESDEAFRKMVFPVLPRFRITNSLVSILESC
jgi:DNA-binding response OmpR family regulator